MRRTASSGAVSRPRIAAISLLRHLLPMMSGNHDVEVASAAVLWSSKAVIDWAPQLQKTATALYPPFHSCMR